MKYSKQNIPILWTTNVIFEITPIMKHLHWQIEVVFDTQTWFSVKSSNLFTLWQYCLGALVSQILNNDNNCNSPMLLVKKWHSSVSTETFEWAQYLLTLSPHLQQDFFLVSSFLPFVVAEPSRMKYVHTEGCHMGLFREFVFTVCCTDGQSNTTTVQLH